MERCSGKYLSSEKKIADTARLDSSSELQRNGRKSTG